MAADLRDLRCPGSLERTLAALAYRHRVPGVQLVIRTATGTVSIAHGEREYAGRRRITTDTAVPIGSITKAFTATVAMILAAEGDVELDEPVGLHVGGLTAPAADLTLRHLLSHTGGLAGGSTGGSAGEPTAAMSAQRYLVEHCGAGQFVAAPGAAFSYSNIGYVLAGRLIEEITGMSWHEAVKAIVLRPLGIDPCFVVGAASDAAGEPACERPMATGHSANAGSGRVVPVRQSLAPAEAAAGALALSALDLARFGALHVQPGVTGVLSPAWAERMRRPVPGADPCGLADGWGLGLAAFRHGSTQWFGHDGNADGTACYLRVEPVNGWVVACTTNASSGYDLWCDVLELLAECGVPIEPRRPQPAPIAGPEVAACAGSYRNGELTYEVLRRNGALCLAVDGEIVGKMVVRSDLSFTLEDSDSGRADFGGRFVRQSGRDAMDGVRVGGRFAKRTTNSRRY